uniref:UDP-N-acetylmuramoyl-tripeptide--D-alanyl-D-alanine ligase n=1 Tax=Desulfobacca acetoxidans TaxID=60893 RepID=A0A7C5AMN7_9BACT
MPAIFRAQEVVLATRGRLLQGRGEESFLGISTDSRSCQTGELFIPLRGEKYDGHHFIPKALIRGVRGVLVEKGKVPGETGSWLFNPGGAAAFPPEVTVVEVPDTLTALGDLARAWRRRFSLPVVCLTGSCGKTTVKEMTARVLGRVFRVLKNELNLNNLIGLPWTLLRLDSSHEAAVLEMGMNRFGEIRRLTEISEPTVGVLLNVHPAHTEGVGGMEGVALAKGELVQALSPEATLIYNADDPQVSRRAASFPGRCISFGFGPGAEVRGKDRRPQGPQGQALQVEWRKVSWTLPLAVPGEHQALNALAATAVGLALGVPPEETVQALRDFVAIHRRSQIQRLPGGINLFNDCYNANPGSMAVALKTLLELKGSGRAAAALGDMLELGTLAAEAHRELGRQAARVGLDFLVIYGNHRFEVAQGAEEAGFPASQLYPVASREEGARLLKDWLRPGDWLLVKGSRSMHMEGLIKFLEEGEKGG